MIPAFNPYNTGQSVKIKHFSDTYFIACDEFDSISVVKMLLLETMKQHGKITEPDDPDLKLKAADI